ncbi:MAG: hypothetical protein R3Y27_04250 [Clostridia bacterium]
MNQNEILDLKAGLQEDLKTTQTFVKNHAKVYSKKALSVLLAVTMLLTTCSVAFGLMASAATTSVMDSLVTAIKTQTVLDLMDAGVASATYSGVTSTTSTASSTGNTTVSRTVTFTQYTDYVTFTTLVELVMEEADYLISNNGQGGYSDGIGSASFDGENAYSIYTQLCSNLSTEMGDDYSTYSVANLMKIIFYNWADYSGIYGELDEKAYGDKDWGHAMGDYDGNQYLWLYYDLNVVTTDVAGWLEYTSNTAQNYASMNLESTYRVTMAICEYSTTSCGSTSYYRAWTFAESSYIPTSPTSETAGSTATTFIAAANTLKTAGDAAIATYPSFTEVADAYTSEVAGVSSALTDTYDAYIDAYADLVDVIGDWDNDVEDEATLISSLYSSIESYEKFLSNYEEVIANLDDLVDAAETLEEFEATNTTYDIFDACGFDRDTIEADYAVYCSYYEQFDSEKVEYFYDGTSYALTTEYYTTFTDNVDAYAAQDYNDTLKNLTEVYGAVEEIDVESMSADELSAAYTLFNTNLDLGTSYSDQVVTAVFTDEELVTYNEYKYLFQTNINSAVEFFLTYSGDISDVETAELLAIFTTSTFDTQNAALTSLYNSIVDTTSEEYAESILGDVMDDATNLYDYIFTELADRLTSQVGVAYSAYLKAAQADGTLIFSVDLYVTLKSTVGELETDIYDVMQDDSTTEKYLLEGTISQYETLMTYAVPGYEAYAECYGFSSYKTVDYGYTDRVVYDDDVLKEESYEVTDDTLTEVIDTVDSLLADEDVLAVVTDLLGVETATSLYEIVMPLVEDMLFTDDIVNMIVELLYPLIQGEFDDVWATLPPDYTYSGIYLELTYEKELIDILYDGVTLNTAYTFNEDAGPSSFAGTATHTAIYPSSLAKVLVADCGYSSSDEIVIALTNAGLDWTSEYICDEDGSLDLNWGVDEACAAIDAAIADGTYDESIHGTKLDVFTTTMGNALQGLYPILAALLLNQTWDFWSEDMASTSGEYSYGITFQLNMTIDLNLGATANNGYINALGAIYETLGYYDYADQTTVESISNGVEMVEMLFTDVYAAVENLLSSPIENILNVIPEVMYGLIFDMIPYILSQLKTTIYYNAYCNMTDLGTTLSLANSVAGLDLPNYLYALGDGVAIDVGEMFDLSTMGIDTTNGLAGLLKSVGLDIYGLGLDEGVLASLGTIIYVETNRTAAPDYQVATYDDEGAFDGYDYTITGDTIKTIKADTNGVLYYLLETILASVKTGDFYEVLEVFMDEDAVQDVSDIISGILSPTSSATDVIASICELFSSEKYAEAEYFVLDVVTRDDTYIAYSEDDGKYVSVTLADLEEAGVTDYLTVPYGYDFDETTGEITNSNDLLYSSEYWTEDQAEYLLENLPTSVDSILSLLGIDISAVLGEEISVLLEDLLASLYTTGTVDSIIDLVDGYIGEYLTDETITMIIDIVADLDLVNIDVAGIVEHLQNLEYTAFEDGDRDGFVAAIVDLVEPLVPVLKLFLVDDASITAYTTTDEDGTESSAIEIYSYNGYESAIVPILEALGCDSEDMVDYDTFAALEDAAMVEAILNPILGLLDSVLSEELFYKLFEIVPNILYFVESNALNTAIENLLRPVYAVLDTIRPIYNLKFSLDIDIMDLVDGLIAGLGIEGYIDISVSELLSQVLDYGVTEERESVIEDTTYNYLVIDEMYYSEIFSTVLYEVADSVTALENIEPYVNIVIALTDFLPESDEVTELVELLEAFNGLESTEQVLFLVYHMVTGFETLTDEAAALITEPMQEVLDLIGGFTANQYAGIAGATNDLVTELGDKLEDWGFVEDGEETVSFLTSFITWIQEFFAMLASVFGL